MPNNMNIKIVGNVRIFVAKVEWNKSFAFVNRCNKSRLDKNQQVFKICVFYATFQCLFRRFRFFLNKILAKMQPISELDNCFANMKPISMAGNRNSGYFAKLKQRQ